MRRASSKAKWSVLVTNLGFFLKLGPICDAPMYAVGVGGSAPRVAASFRTQKDLETDGKPTLRI